jgi:hypothetical protein
LQDFRSCRRAMRIPCSGRAKLRLSRGFPDHLVYRITPYNQAAPMQRETSQCRKPRLSEASTYPRQGLGDITQQLAGLLNSCDS